MMTDEQVRLLRRKRMEGKTLQAAAAVAGMCERSGRTWQEGALPSETKGARAFRTRPDPFAEKWGSDIEPLLRDDKDGRLEAKAVLKDLIRRYPGGQFEAGHLRTLQRRFRDWRAVEGPAKEVYFPQEHPPGVQAAIDFTHATELGVHVGGKLLEHLFFHLVMAFSKYHVVQLAYGETFEALLSGLQHALYEVGGVPQVVRMDNLSAATHELREGGRTLTARFREVAQHFDFEPRRIEPGKGNQNGVAEKGHDVLKRALEQALRLRGHRAFATVAEYLQFVQDVVERDLNAESRLAQEKGHLKALPASRFPEYTKYCCRVRLWSTVHVAGRTYSVPSRLIGYRVEVRVHPNEVEVHYKGQLLERMPRLRGRALHHIDYRHVIWSLVRKPGAFAAYKYREEMFPTLVFRRVYDELCRSGSRAEVEYVRILHLAASTSEAEVEAVLAALLEAGERPEYAKVRAHKRPEPTAVPQVQIEVPDLRVYDGLLGGAA